MSLVEKNQYGYWESQHLKDCCVLLATLNVLEARHELDEQEAQQIAERFRSIQVNDPRGDFIETVFIPRTIERITDEKYYGVLRGPNARELMRNIGIGYERKYATDTDYFLRSDYPCIVGCRGKSKGSHAVTAVNFDWVTKESALIDNGVPVVKKLYSVDFVYEIRRNRNGDSFRMLDWVFQLLGAIR
jgi:hypothetical protein